MVVPPALLSHDSTDHYTPQYILNTIIACVGAIDPGPCSNSKEIPNMPAARPLYHPGRREHCGVQGAAEGDDRGGLCGEVYGEAVIYRVPELRLHGSVRDWGERGVTMV
jgi:hypothetical protein